MNGDPYRRRNELPGWATSVETPDSQQADSAVGGILVVDGNVLVIAVTSDDAEWARATWRSIRPPVARIGASSLRVRRCA